MIAFQNKAAVYAILFKAAAEAMMMLARTRAGSAPRSASSPSCRHGVRRRRIIPMSIASFQAVVFLRWRATDRWTAEFFLAVKPLSRLFRRLFLERLAPSMLAP